MNTSPPRLAFLLLACCALLFCVAGAPAQITQITIDGQGRRHSCTQSGMRGWSRDCGADPFYAYIFVGTVLEAKPDKDHETALKVRPEEVFLGDKPDELAFITSQGECLPEFHAGDRWLFYLYKEMGTKKLVVAYGHPSTPLAEADKQLASLRRLQGMQNTGVLQGEIERAITGEDPSIAYFPVKDQKVLATSKDSKAHYTAVSDKDGIYEFPPLPIGTYDLTANTTKGLWAEEGSVNVKPHSCTAVDFTLQPDGAISGQVKNVDGTPKPYLDVRAESVVPNSEQYFFASTDENGNFQIHGLGPGRYLVSIDIAPKVPGTSTEHLVYYPGVENPNNASTIELGQAEKRADINFNLLP